MLTKIDRYILRQFILTFLFGILAFILIYIVVHLMEHLDEFFDHNVPTPLILEYYILFLPEIVQLIVPIAMLLSSLFTMGRLDTTHELTAIRAAGRSMPRIALPLLVFGLIVSVGMIYFNGWTVPSANKKRYAIDRQYVGGNPIGGARDVYLRLSPSTNLMMNYFDPLTNTAHRVSIERFDTAATQTFVQIVGRSGTDLVKKVDSSKTIMITERIDAPLMRYDTAKKIWIMPEGVARNFMTPGRIVTTTFTEREMPSVPVTPKELDLSQQNTPELTLDELRERIEQEKLGGRDVYLLLVDYYAKFAYPFSAFIVILFGIPFSSTQRKGGAAIPIAITALTSAVYLILTEVSKTFSYGTTLHPAVTAWMANIVFMLVGLLNMFRVSRA